MQGRIILQKIYRRTAVYFHFMRDKRLIAEHPGGILTPEHHRLLVGWSRECTEQILKQVGLIDNRLTEALRVVWHAVATAHMADHAPGVLLYGLKALSVNRESNAGKAKVELLKLLDRLPDTVSVPVRESFEKKESYFWGSYHSGN
jgi:hypothetical protein